MPTNKLHSFLSSGRNIAGCLLALCGLGLFFGHVIHAYWWAIVPGLYAVGVAAWPRDRAPVPARAVHPEVSAERLAQQLRRLVDSVIPGLPNDAVTRLYSIEGTFRALVPRLRELRDRGIISAKDSFTVTETVRRYLPDTLGAYLRLPKAYAQMQPLADGKTASQTLLEQLRVLDLSLKDIAKSAFEGDAQKLITNGQFLQSRFSEKLAFRP